MMSLFEALAFAGFVVVDAAPLASLAVLLAGFVVLGWATKRRRRR